MRRCVWSVTVGRDRVISTGAAAALLVRVRPLVWKSFPGLCGGVRERVVPLPRPGEYDVWRVVRQKLARISKSKAALVAAAAVAAAAVIGTTVGYASMGTSVTLNVDGHIEHVTATGDTVGQVLSDQGITLQSHDEVAPAVDQPVSDGTTIAVRYGKPLQLERRRQHLDVLGDGHRRARSAATRSTAASTAPTCRSAAARASPATACGSPWPPPRS